MVDYVWVGDSFFRRFDLYYYGEYIKVWVNFFDLLNYWFVIYNDFMNLNDGDFWCCLLIIWVVCFVIIFGCVVVVIVFFVGLLGCEVFICFNELIWDCKFMLYL